MPTPLSRERILQCALQVADREGIDRTSLRLVAAELGVHVTSLYHHVATKDALLDGLIEELFATPELPVGEVAWDQWVRQFVSAVVGLARAHPGAFALLLRRPVQGPRATTTFEAGLAAFHRAGMDAAASYAAVKSVTLSVLGACLEESYAASGRDELVTDMSQLSPQEFPRLHESMASMDGLDVVAALTEILVAGLSLQVSSLRSG